MGLRPFARQRKLPRLARRGRLVLHANRRHRLPLVAADVPRSKFPAAVHRPLAGDSHQRVRHGEAIGRRRRPGRGAGRAQVRNFNKWGGFSTTTPHLYNPKPHANYAAAVADLKNYITARMAWIDSQYTAPPAFNQNGGPITPGFNLTMSAVAGTIYYTLDGTDPRASGGGISPTASLQRHAHHTQPEHPGYRPAKPGSGRARLELVPRQTVLHRIAAAGSQRGQLQSARSARRQSVRGRRLRVSRFRTSVTLPVDLEGFQFVNGVEYTFGPGPNIPAPGAYAIIVRNQTAFEERYPGRAGAGSIRRRA